MLMTYAYSTTCLCYCYGCWQNVLTAKIPIHILYVNYLSSLNLVSSILMVTTYVTTQKCTLANQFRCICMNLTHVCWSRDVYSNPCMPHIGTGCMATKLPINTYHCMEMAITHLCCQHCFHLSTVRTYCMCTVYMFFMFVTFHVCSIHRLDTWERYAFTHLDTYF